MSKKEAATRLIVEQTTQGYYHLGNNHTFEGRAISLGRYYENGSTLYLAIDDLSRTNRAEVLLRTEEGLTPVALPKEMNQRLGDYLAKEKSIRMFIEKPPGVKGLVVSSLQTLNHHTPVESVSDWFERQWTNLMIITRPEENYDCVSFAHELNGVPYTYPHYDASLWQTQQLEKDSLKPGDTILIYNSEDIPAHMAIYLQDDLYLSKFGPGRLMVNDLVNLKHGFEGKRVQLVTPVNTQ